MQRSAFLLELDLDDLFCVVPCPAGIGHEDGLIETKDGDRNQVADEEERFNKRECQRGEKHSQEDIEHTLLRVLGADFHHLLAVFDRRFHHAFQLDVGLDEFHRAIRTCGYGLRGSAGEPVDDRAACYQSEHKGSVQQ